MIDKQSLVNYQNSDTKTFYYIEEISCIKETFNTMEELFEHYIKYLSNNVCLDSIFIYEKRICLNFLCSENYDYSIFYNTHLIFDKETELINMYRQMKRNYNINKLLI